MNRPDATPITTEPPSPAPSPPVPRLRVDLGALTRNYARLRTLAPGAEIAAVVKADAYGLDAARIGPVLHRAGCRTFFTATASEGAALRAGLGGVTARIFVLNGFGAHERGTLKAADLIPVLNTPGEIEAFAADPGGPCALHIDTGMNRLGLSAEDAERLAADAGLMERLDLTLTMSHLACADTPGHPMNAAQKDRFEAVAKLFPEVPKSLANTGGALLGPDFHYDLIRPGIGLYGGSPAGPGEHPFEPVLSIETPILQLRRLKPGETVGYGASWTATRDTLAATVALGYADGLMRSAQGGFARVDGQRVPLIGRVSMDLCVLDVTDCKTVSPGEPAVFLGPDLEDLAETAGTIGYELLTRLGRRFARSYEGDR